MGWLDKLRGAPPAPNTPRSRQLPSHVVDAAFGEVNVVEAADGVTVRFTILMEPTGQEAEGWQTGVALDGSASMKSWYGQMLEGSIPPDALREYDRRGWMDTREEDGRVVRGLSQQAFDDARVRGYVRVSTNIVEPSAREFIAYLAGKLDEDGGTTVVYWACGDGSAVEVVGDFTEAQCRALPIQGPQTEGFGGGTALLPAVRYFVDRFKDARRAMYVFLTDGRIEDLDAVKRFTTTLARDIAAGRRGGVKCVLVGVGDEVDENQMEELDDLDTGTAVDIWDHKIAKDMRSIVEIFAEVVGEHQIVAPSAVIFDSHGTEAKTFRDGLPARVEVKLRPGSDWFELEVAGKRIRQSIRVP